MSTRPQASIEDFDDDTEIPLPSRPLPDTGSKGVLLQSVDSDSEDDADDSQRLSSTADLNPGPASPSQLPPGFGLASPGAARGGVTDLTPYKKWTCIYPIYIDAKRRYGIGSRRISRTKAVWWPLSKDIADATTRLGLGTLHEVQKSHPSDWDNPGRVRVQWKRDGKLVNERIKTKKMLLEAIAFYIQSVKPEFIPKPPFNYKPPQHTSASVKSPAKPSKSAQKLSSKSKSKEKEDRQKQKRRAPRRRLPQAPEPLTPLASRVSAYSPAQPGGMLVDTVKAGLAATAAENANAPAGGGKGKRKVVRVRGFVMTSTTMTQARHLRSLPFIHPELSRTTRMNCSQYVFSE